MEGAVVVGFQMLQKHDLIPTWADLAKTIERHFGPSRFDNPRARIFKLVQARMIAAYYTEFIMLANRMEGMSNDAILDCFINGLKPSLRRDLLVQEPSTLIRAAELAKLYDDTGTSISWGTRNATRSWHGSPTPSTSVSKPMSSLPNLATTSQASVSKVSKVPAFKHFSAAELRAKREKRLCYYCDEKYSPNRKCKPSYCLLLGSEELSAMVDGASPDSDEGGSPEDVAL